MMRVLAFLVAALAGPTAFADMATPAPKGKSDSSGTWLLENELATHGPPGTPGGTNPDAKSSTKTGAAPSEALRNFEGGHCGERKPPATVKDPPPAPPPQPPAQPRESLGPEQPLDFVDATLEVSDVVSRFHSSRPVVKRPPPNTPHLRGASK